jgi:hypothetical protein
MASSQPTSVHHATQGGVASPVVATLDITGRRFVVTCRIAFDGVEHVGRLWFAPEDGEEEPTPDRAAIGGRNREEVLQLAGRLSEHELTLRHRRAMAEKRRFVGLRSATDEILAKIRFMNQIAISMRAGLIDREGAAQELDLTERQICELVARLKEQAGMET